MFFRVHVYCVRSSIFAWRVRKRKERPRAFLGHLRHTSGSLFQHIGEVRSLNPVLAKAFLRSLWPIHDMSGRRLSLVHSSGSSEVCARWHCSGGRCSCELVGGEMLAGCGLHGLLQPKETVVMSWLIATCRPCSKKENHLKRQSFRARRVFWFRVWCQSSVWRVLGGYGDARA